ncbi:damage-inducible protein DinB [Rhodobacterales bacterium HKCCE4037]|nr:damage-inducible protein DinB [Rhodobacterales bacterium HKCCE4037]
MARYNAWQNQWMFAACDGLDAEARQADRGLFFGSIERTLSHLMWGDTTWIARFDGGPGPGALMQQSAEAYDWPTLMAERPRLDARIAAWAWSLTPEETEGMFRWTSSSTGQSFEKPFAHCLIQIFNHQTHHRGQVHGALTALGVRTVDTDLPYMPDEVPEWH